MKMSDKISPTVTPPADDALMSLRCGLEGFVARWSAHCSVGFHSLL